MQSNVDKKENQGLLEKWSGRREKMAMKGEKWLRMHGLIIIKIKAKEKDKNEQKQ